MITICLTYFRSLTLANLAAALYSVRRQDLSQAAAIVVFNNNTRDPHPQIQAIVDALAFPVPVLVHSARHEMADRTHAWSTNRAVVLAGTPWVFFTRADYVLSFDAVASFLAERDRQSDDWRGFITSNGCHLWQDVQMCESTSWRVTGPQIFRGEEFDYTCIDAGVWMTRRDLFQHVGGLDERLTAWGHAQTQFQYKLHTAGVECVRIPRTLFFHPKHDGPRDLVLAHQQLAAQGEDLRAMWARYHGVSPY